MINLTEEQAQQIEEAFASLDRAAFDVVTAQNRTEAGIAVRVLNTALESSRKALAIIRAARAREQAHLDDEAVDRFAAAMKAKLAKKRAEGRGGWEDKNQCSAEFLNRLLNEHVGKGDPVDVGNLAMMLWNRGERTEVVREQESGPFNREFLVNLILCSLQIRMEVTNVVDATKAAEHIVDTYMTPKFCAQYLWQAQQEPVAIADGTFNHNCPLGTPLYAAPIHTKDLTEQEIQDAIINISPTGTGYFLRIARAVIAKFKEKNK